MATLTLTKSPEQTVQKMYNGRMSKLTKRQIERQDFVDNEIFELIQRLTPSAKLKWDIEMIGNIRDSIQTQLVDNQKLMSEARFYP